MKPRLPSGPRTDYDYVAWMFHRRRSLRNLVRYGLLYWPDPACEPALTARSRAWLRANPPWRTRRRS